MTVADRRAAPPVGGQRDSVRLTAVSKVFGRGESAVRALDNVSLEVPPGEFTCLIGASGCGKSTLLSLVAGLEQPTSGEVSAGGGRVAFMFQEPALFPWLTAAGNVELPLKIRKVPRTERRGTGVQDSARRCDSSTHRIASRASTRATSRGCTDPP